MANLLIERTQNGQWCVVFKSLVTIHNLMCYGNEVRPYSTQGSHVQSFAGMLQRFTQYLASCNCDLNLTNYLDKTSVNGSHLAARKMDP